MKPALPSASRVRNAKVDDTHSSPTAGFRKGRCDLAVEPVAFGHYDHNVDRTDRSGLGMSAIGDPRGCHFGISHPWMQHQVNFRITVDISGGN